MAIVYLEYRSVMTKTQSSVMTNTQSLSLLRKPSRLFSEGNHRACSGRNLGQARGGERGKTRTSLRLRAIYDERRPHKDSKTGTGGHTTGSTHRSQCLIAPTKSCPRRQRHERQVTRQGRHIERRQRLPAKNPDSSRTEALHARTCRILGGGIVNCCTRSGA